MGTCGRAVGLSRSPLAVMSEAGGEGRGTRRHPQVALPLQLVNVRASPSIFRAGQFTRAALMNKRYAEREGDEESEKAEMKREGDNGREREGDCKGRETKR